MDTSWSSSRGTALPVQMETENWVRMVNKGKASLHRPQRLLLSKTPVQISSSSSSTQATHRSEQTTDYAGHSLIHPPETLPAPELSARSCISRTRQLIALSAPSTVIKALLLSSRFIVFSLSRVPSIGAGTLSSKSSC